MIKIITVGSIKEKYLKDAIEEYQKRLKKYTDLEIIEIKDEGLLPAKQAMEKEAEKIKKHINEKEYIILGRSSLVTDKCVQRLFGRAARRECYNDDLLYQRRASD